MMRKKGNNQNVEFEIKSSVWAKIKIRAPHGVLTLDHKENKKQDRFEA